MIFKRKRCQHNKTTLVKRELCLFDGWSSWENRYYICENCLKITVRDWSGHLSSDEFHDNKVGTIFESKKGKGDRK